MSVLPKKTSLDDNLSNLRCVALAGGVGGSRLSRGLYRSLADGRLTVIVNTGDDFEHLGLRICPDLDTVMYALADLANPDTGWGVRDDTWNAMTMLGRLGEDTWFKIGDSDLATHLHRTRWLRQGKTLTEITRHMGEALQVKARLLPMCDTPVSTFVTIRSGERLAFQDYFVKRSHRDEVASISLAGIESASTSEGVAAAIASADAIIFCPSNPFVSIDPILQVPGMRALLRAAPARRVAVSPIVGGQAVRGPAADMLRSMGHEASAVGVARLYRDLIDVLIIDEADAHLASAVREVGPEPLVAPTIMHGDEERQQLATIALRASVATSVGP